MPEIERHIKDLKHEDREVRWKAAALLGNIGHPDAVPALIEALKDEKWSVRQNAAKAVGKIGHVDAISVLGETLKDDHAWVRDSAADSLVKIGRPALKELIRAHEDADEEGRKLIEGTIKKILRRKENA